MKTLKRILITVLTAITVIACTDKKEDYPEQLPKATQTGENTAGCYVNGKLWIMRGGVSKTFGPSFTSVIYREPSISNNYYNLSIGITDKFYSIDSKDNALFSDIFLSIHSIDDITQKKEYKLSEFKNDDNNSRGASIVFELENNKILNLKTNSKNTGTLTITKLVTTGKKPFIAGTFKFTVTASTGEVFKITNGRFDLELNKILQ